VAILSSAGWAACPAQRCLRPGDCASGTKQVHQHYLHRSGASRVAIHAAVVQRGAV